jgi:hypothetical protein
VWRDICPLSGQLAAPDCPYARHELFIAGTEPQAECDQHVRVAVDRRTGEPVTAETPPDGVIEDGVIEDGVIEDGVIEKVYWVPPPELREWARERGIPQLTSQQISELALSSDTGSVSQRTSALANLPTCQLALTSPDPNAAFVLASFIPHDHQRIEVKAEVYTPTQPQRVTLYVDGEVLAVLDAPPYRALWTLESGNHTFYAVAESYAVASAGAQAHDGSDLRSEPITIQVEVEAEEE